jgi:hypothetical protein
MQDIFLFLHEKLLYASSVCGLGAALRTAQYAGAQYALGPGEVQSVVGF